MLPEILDRAYPPVGRLRVMSGGLARANTFRDREAVAGSQACLACGNCVDACPVLADRGARLDVMRTSMSLESLVGTDCRRCYRCIAVCPQVDRELKDGARTHRRTEHLAHYLVAAAFVALSLTGLVIYYVVPLLPTDFHLVLGLIHRVAVVAFVVAPIIYVVGDPRQARRTLGRLVRWDNADRAWLRDIADLVRSLGRTGRLGRGDLNPAQRTWYLFIIAMLVVFGVTGAMQWIAMLAFGKESIEGAAFVHVWAARLADVAVLGHISLKVLWPLVRDARNLLATSRPLQHGGLWPAARRGR